MKIVWKVLSILIALSALLFGILPFITYGIFHSGTIALLAFGSVLLLLALLWDWIPWKALRYVLAGVLFMLFLIGSILSGIMMKYGFFNEPASDTSGTVIVLGCKIQDDQPSTMLRNRLERALDYLKEHPESPVIVAGGKGQDERYTEAYVMKKYLTEHGIDETRIYQEDSSTNTEENIAMSRAVIQERDLPQNMIIVSDSFHLYRATLHARQLGISCSSIHSQTPVSVFLGYWVREILGILHTTLL